MWSNGFPSPGRHVGSVANGLGSRLDRRQLLDPCAQVTREDERAAPALDGA
jgi:hypothetical protein